MAAEEEEAVAVVAVEEEEVAEEVVEVEVVGREAMATISPRAQSRPGRGPGPARPLRAMPT